LTQSATFVLSFAQRSNGLAVTIGNLPSQFAPLHSAHSIEQVAIALAFESPIEATALALADEVVKASRPPLPKREELINYQMAVGPGPDAKPKITQAQQQAGMLFQRYANNGVMEAELRVELNRVVFRTFSYTRWQHVWAEANGYFTDLREAYSGTKLSAIGLDYIDKYVWQNSEAPWILSTLLRRDSPFVAPHIHDVADLWHCHSGSFTRPNAATKRLLNVNIDALEEAHPQGRRRVISIRTAITDFLNQDGFDRTDVTPTVVDRVWEDHMEKLHAAAKEYLGKIINEKMATLIQLNAS
jgi:uncharacterized protein (TIGR04255 family)